MTDEDRLLICFEMAASKVLHDAEGAPIPPRDFAARVRSYGTALFKEYALARDQIKPVPAPPEGPPSRVLPSGSPL